MCPVPPQGVLKGLNTSLAAAILCDPPETNQVTTDRKEGRFRWKIGSHLFRRLTGTRFASLLGIRNPPSLPTPIPLPNPPTPPTSTLLSSYTASSLNSSRMPAHDTAQHDYEMTPLRPSPKYSAVTLERMRSQDSTSSQRRRDDGDYPPPSYDPSSIYRSQPYRSQGSVSPQLHKSIAMDTTSPQGPHSHPSSDSSRMTRTPSTFLLGHGPQATGTMFESGLASGTGQTPADRQGRRTRFPSALQTLLSNDFRCVVRCRADSHNNCCIIIHRFRILVVGKVCIMYRTGRRRN
jgi:hypothetical protein